SKSPARARRSTPKARCSAGTGAPRPTAGSRRPPDRRSRLASSLATTTGLRPGRTSTLVPSFNRRVRPAATARPTNGSGAGPARRSLSHSESKPRRSSRSTSAETRSASPAGVCVPSPKPMRTFTPPLPSPAAGRAPRSEDDQPVGQLGDLVDVAGPGPGGQVLPPAVREDDDDRAGVEDRKSTRLNS